MMAAKKHLLLLLVGLLFMFVVGDTIYHYKQKEDKGIGGAPNVQPPPSNSSMTEGEKDGRGFEKETSSSESRMLFKKKIAIGLAMLGCTTFVFWIFNAMNAALEKNKQLEKKNKQLENSPVKSYNNVLKKNKQLKKENERLKNLQKNSPVKSYNNLVKENEQLKKENERLKNLQKNSPVKSYNNLVKENKQLEKKNKQLENSLVKNSPVKNYNNVLKENKQLKKENERLKNLQKNSPVKSYNNLVKENEQLRLFTSKCICQMDRRGYFAT